MTEFSYPLKVYLLIGLFGLMTLAFSANRLAEAQAYRDDYPFRTQYARLARAKAMLSGERMAGYFTNIDSGRQSYARLYFPTQYVMAPTLLVPLEDAPAVEFVLGNFTRQDDYAARGKELGLEVVQEFPMGVVLYRRQKGSPPPAPNAPLRDEAR